MSDKPGKITEAMSDIMADIGAITKANTASMGGGGTYKFRGIDDVYNALHPIMTKHKVFILPELLQVDSQERLTSNDKKMGYVQVQMKYTFTHADGSSVTVSVPGEGMDTGDKATGKALSGALKYALFQAFMIPTEEVKDAEADHHERGTVSDKGTTVPTTGTVGKVEGVDKEGLIVKIGNICMQIADGDKEQAGGILYELTHWVDDEGEVKREGVRTALDLKAPKYTVPALKTIYGKAKKALETWEKAHGPVESEDDDGSTYDPATGEYSW